MIAHVVYYSVHRVTVGDLFKSCVKARSVFPFIAKNIDGLLVRVSHYRKKLTDSFLSRSDKNPGANVIVIHAQLASGFFYVWKRIGANVYQRLYAFGSQIQ